MKLYDFSQSPSWNIRRIRQALSKRITPDMGLWARRSLSKDLVRFLDTKKPIIIDGGANNGGSAVEFLSIFPEARIFCYEPTPDLALQLKKRFKDDNRVEIRESALGAERGTATFNVTKYHGASSTLPPREFFDTESPYHLKKTISVQQVALKEDIQEQVDFIKFDLQGGELDALKGCGDSMLGAKAIYIEMNFYPTYNNQPSFSEIDQYLRKKGFRIFNFYDLYTAPEENPIQTGQLTYGDALYVRT